MVVTNAFKFSNIIYKTLSTMKTYHALASSYSTFLKGTKIQMASSIGGRNVSEQILYELPEGSQPDSDQNGGTTILPDGFIQWLIRDMVRNNKIKPVNGQLNVVPIHFSNNL
jgi:hypothetical protein